MGQWDKIYKEKAELKDLSTYALLKVQPNSAYIFYTDTYWITGKPYLPDDEDFTLDGYLFLTQARIHYSGGTTNLPVINKSPMKLAIDKIIAFQPIDEVSL